MRQLLLLIGLADHLDPFVEHAAVDDRVLGIARLTSKPGTMSKSTESWLSKYANRRADWKLRATHVTVAVSQDDPIPGRVAQSDLFVPAHIRVLRSSHVSTLIDVQRYSRK